MVLVKKIIPLIRLLEEIQLNFELLIQIKVRVFTWSAFVDRRSLQNSLMAVMGVWEIYTAVININLPRRRVKISIKSSRTEIPHQRIDK